MNNFSERPALSEPTSGNESFNSKPGFGIGTKIILPYLLLTLILAGVGAFVLSNLVTSSLRERINNQLLDAGRMVSISNVSYENRRLQTLRAVAGTVGVPDAVATSDPERLSQLVPQIIANSNSHAVKLLNDQGIEIFGWQQIPSLSINGPSASSGEDFSKNEEVVRILTGYVDSFGDKRIIFHDEQDSLVLYTAGPVYFDEELVGVVMVGDEVRQMVQDLTVAATARVTLYDQQGRVLETTLGGGEEPAGLDQSQAILDEDPDFYREVSGKAANTVLLQEVDLLEQEYVLAFTDWRMRGQSFGLFSVALSSNFIVSALVTSRNTLSLIFAAATIGVLAVGFFTAQRIIRPVDQLVDTALAVTAGDLEKRSGIQSQDEIGKLAKTFDFMTARLAQRNRELTEQASKLEAILNSIADGVIVLDMDDQFITTNEAAQKLLADMSNDFSAGPLRELTSSEPIDADSTKHTPTTPGIASHLIRYQIGNRVLSTRAAAVKTPDGGEIGKVIVLRDITSEAEADHLKDAFITNISHELRTPLTVIKVYTDLIMKSGNSHLDERQLGFLQKISNNSDHLEQHINQLINISEIQAGSFNLEMEKVNFVTLIRTVAENWRERMDSKGLALEVDMPEEPLWIFGDPNQMSWAAETLLSNALNYTETGSVKVKVFAEKDEIRLDVQDTGIGIASVDQPRLFDRFYRASNAANYNVRGVGLGLYITRSIVEMHNGRIWLESESGQGSTFSIALPQAD